jgi:hypothetical protein
MPLQDHFRPPLSTRRHWHAFHNSWATYISSALNERLPKGFFAEANVQYGIEVDVGAFDEDSRRDGPVAPGWTPPEPAGSVPVRLATDRVEVLVFGGEGGPVLAGALELVSPSNKDQPSERQAFVAKCQSYLNQRVGLVVVDVVTQRPGNLHNELLTRLSGTAAPVLDADLYAVAYRPRDRDEQQALDVWPEALALGRPLPTLPLWLLGGPCLPVDLEATYMRTCREQRVGANGA